MPNNIVDNPAWGPKVARSGVGFEKKKKIKLKLLTHMTLGDWNNESCLILRKEPLGICGARLTCKANL